MDKPLKSLKHGQCYARSTVIVPVAGHRCPETGTKLYCLVTEAHVCEELAQGRYLTAARPGVQCDARPTVTFQVAGHRCLATGTKLYCLVTQAHVCEHLAQGHYLTVVQPGVELATSRVASQRLNHYTTRPHRGMSWIKQLLFICYGP